MCACMLFVAQLAKVYNELQNQSRSSGEFQWPRRLKFLIAYIFMLVLQISASQCKSLPHNNEALGLLTNI